VNVQNCLMAAYIEPRNQELLWKGFQRIPEVTHLSRADQETIFKQAVSHQYAVVAGLALTPEQLLEINKRTLSMWIQQLRQSQPSGPFPSPMVESVTENTTRIFEEKQKQYESMTAKPVLPKPSELFQEAETDDKITNMDELISQYQQQRDLDLPQYEPIDSSITQSPATPVDSLNSPPTMSSQSHEEIMKAIESLTESIVQLEKRLAVLETEFKGFASIL
jgi:hypothetical protein